MAVGFRSFLKVDPDQSLVEGVISHITKWSVNKQIPVDAAIPGRYALDNDNLLTVVRETLGQHQVYRWRRHHPNAEPRDVWRTTFTAMEHPRTGGWLWTEIETFDAPREVSPTLFSCMSVPRVLRDLLSELACRDGRTEITSGPQWVARNHLPDLMDYLADESRLGAVYVASQGSRCNAEFLDWATQVTWHLVGLGSVFLLDPAIAPEFNEMVGEHHAVPEGTIRTYLPGVDLDDPLDPRRHKILGIGRITGSTPRRLAGMLGLIERMRAAHAAIPGEALELDQILTASEAELLPPQRPTSLRAVWTAVVPEASPSGSSTSAAAVEEIHLLRRSFEETIGRYRAEHESMLSLLEALLLEVQGIRESLGTDTPLQARRLSAS